MLLFHQHTRSLLGRRALNLQPLLYFFVFLKVAAQPETARLKELFQLLHTSTVLLERRSRSADGSPVRQALLAAGGGP